MKKIFALFVLTVLMCSLGNRVLAQNRAIMKPVTETIDFTGWSYNSSSYNRANVNVTWSNNNNNISSISSSDGSISLTRSYTERFSLNNNGTQHWRMWGSGTFQVTYLQRDETDTDFFFYLHNLKENDVVTILGENGNAESGDKGCRIQSGSTDRNGQLMSFNENDPEEGQQFTVTADGDVTLQFYGQYSGIRKITIQSQERETPHFDYDPGYEEYDMYDEFSENDPKKEQTSNNETWGQPYTSYSLSTEATGITLNGNTAKYIILSNSKITANNRIAIDGEAGDWRFNYGLRAPAPDDPDELTWANFSICNLREGDRVVFSYTGTAPVFSSVAGGTAAPTGPYNGSNAFFDRYNDGVFDEGEDTYITAGAQPIEDWSRGEGNIWGEDNGGRNNDNNTPLIYTRYVITEDGHLDLAIAPDTRIVKIKIYSDHQATMIDEYDATSYTAKFDITGELQAMEHIVPGGLEVHVGSDDATQHAHVVSSAQGPVSIVNGVNGFKLPGMYLENGNLKFHFNLNEYIPETGTFYKFMPLEDGDLSITFQATSMNYYTYGLNGDAVYYGSTGSYDENNWSETNDRPNEQTVDVTCPYYLVKVWKDENNVEHKTFTKIGDYGNGAYPPALTIKDAKAGETYYLYGGWNATGLTFSGSGQGQNNIEYFPYGTGNGGAQKACGVAKLLEVEFNPKKKIYPLAKWVPNNTLAVNDGNSVPDPETFAPKYELAELWGYNDKTPITVKKMTGNITACRPYLQHVDGGTEPGHENHYRLMIDGIQYGDGDKGGTILIKIGDATVKNNPVYTLTIAYSTDPTYDGNSGTGTRGHIWDYSSKSLHGLKYEPVLLGHKNKQGDFVNTQQPQDPYDIPVYSSNVAVPDDYGHYFDDYFAADISSYSSKDDVLSSTDQNLQESGSGLLYEEIHGGNSDWMFNYNLVNAGNLFDPVFTNKYAMEYDNADMIWETEGTVIKADANASVMFNEYHGNIDRTVNNGVAVQKYDPDRFVGITKGGEFRIPWLRKNDRVIIYMGTGKSAFSEQATFSIKNAYDAEHNIIDPTDDYVVGGSHWDGEKGDPNYRGCYHFFAQGGPTVDGKTLPADMVFKMTGGSLCKIYSIQIYRGDRIITNEVVGETSDDKFLLWSRAKDPNDANDVAAMGDTYNWTLKYFGKDQKLADGTNGVNNDIVNYNGYYAKTGANINNNGFTTSTETDPTQPTYNTFTYTHDYGQIGTFRARGKDMEKNMKYVADYGEHNVTVAYQQTMEYPYTWDFMDMTGWGNNVQNFEREDAIGSSSSPTYTWPEWFDSEDLWNASYENSSTDLSLWDEDAENDTYYLRLNSQSGQEYPDNMKEKDNIFETAREIDGNQVWANGSIVPETQGLWFLSLDNNRNSNTWGVTNSGMAFNGTSKNILKVVVPNVPTGAAVYLRMVTNRPDFDQAFEFKGGNTDYSVYGPTKVEGTSSEYILAIKNDGAKRHLTFSLAGYQLKKLAVSTDSKAVDSKGWATESRDHIIDTKLLPYFTGMPIKTYFVGAPNYDERTLTLTEVSDEENTDEFVMPASTGCLLYNENKGKADIFGTDTGFHLFVPDMHDGTLLADATATTTGGAKVNMLKEQLTQRNPSTMHPSNPVLAEETVNGVSYTNYVLSYKYYVYNSEGNYTEPVVTDVDMFYRVANTGIGLRANSAYLQLPTDIVKPQGASGAKYTFVFADYDDIFGDDFDGVATGIEGATPNRQNEKNVWYNMNGQKLNGVPTTGGIYILNGKKVFVK